jgi:deazaflavin-dependent oxidoreductase (nitroreductase family)
MVTLSPTREEALAPAAAGVEDHPDDRRDRCETAPDHPPLAERVDAWVTAYPDARVRRLVFRAPLALWRLGLGPMVGHAFVLLTTRGRTSGLPRRVALTPHRMRGHLYVWDPYGERSQWFRNVRADPIVTVQDASGTWTARAVGVGDDQEATELHELLERFGRRQLGAYCEVLGIAGTAATFAANRDRLHIARLEPVSQPGPEPLTADRWWVSTLAVLAAASLVSRRRR